MKIEEKIFDQIVAHAKKDLPNECCGYLAGRDLTVTAAYPITNMDQSHEHYSFDPKEQFAAIKDIREKGLEPIGAYHSHPETPARPSQEDIRLAYDPDISYLIISLAKEKEEVKSFRIRGGQVEKEGIEIT
jgi:[CysO sulfur-carrier protein]-S-L-cysteine hydrolase